MSDGTHLLVPFATGPAQPCQEALRGLQLPQLQRLLRRLALQATDAAGADSLSLPHERVLARAYGLEPVDGLIPLAAVQVRELGGDDGAAGWAWITLAHWRVGQDHIRMAHPRELQLDEAGSRALLDAMRPWFAQDGIALEYDAPVRWLARGEVFRALPSASLDRVIARTVDRWMPAGDAAGPVRRLQQEMQMFLYTLPLNDERQRRGLLPVNSFWVSGTGALPPGRTVAAAPGLLIAPDLRDAALREDWPAWAAAWQQVDAQQCRQLLAELDSGRPVRLTLCGEAGSRSWSSEGAGGWRRLTGWFAPASVATLLEGLA